MSSRHEVAVADLCGEVEVTWVDAHSKTVFFAVLKDEKGRTSEVCIDSREGSPTRHRLFEGSTHPGANVAKLLELGCFEEGMIVPLLSHWLDSTKAREWFTEYARELLQDALVRIGQPPTLPVAD